MCRHSDQKTNFVEFKSDFESGKQDRQSNGHQNQTKKKKPQNEKTEFRKINKSNDNVFLQKEQKKNCRTDPRFRKPDTKNRNPEYGVSLYKSSATN